MKFEAVKLTKDKLCREIRWHKGWETRRGRASGDRFWRTRGTRRITVIPVAKARWRFGGGGGKQEDGAGGGGVQGTPDGFIEVKKSEGKLSLYPKCLRFLRIIFLVPLSEQISIYDQLNFILW